MSAPLTDGTPLPAKGPQSEARPATPSLDRTAGLVVLGLSSAGVVATEVLFTRLLSVCTWYGLAFLVLSLAMLGTTTGALAASRARADGEPLAPWVARRLVVMAFALVAGAAVTSSVPIAFHADLTSLSTVLLMVASATVPMIAGGGAVARLMAELPVPLGRAYAVDLICAALGALAPLALLGPLSGPSALIAVGGSWLSAPTSWRLRGGGGPHASPSRCAPASCS